MRLIQDGAIPKAIWYRMKCGYCNAVFEYQLSETRLVDGPFNRNDRFIDCPTCHFSRNHMNAEIIGDLK